MTDEDWSRELRLLADRGVTLSRGMVEDELHGVEQQHRFHFPPDLRSLLACALPVGPGFPDWRNPGSPVLCDQLRWPFEGIAFDIENHTFWWKPWGPRPEALSDALDIARAAVEGAPRLIPILGHRYLPADPVLEGNPVLSVYQTDIIYYGLDLRRYLACEFGRLEYAEAVRGEPRRIRFWSELVN